MLYTPESTPTPNRRLSRTVAKAAGTLAAIALVPAAIWGITKLSESETRGTHFANAAAAMATLRGDVRAHGDDDDIYGAAQDRMEKDLRGANPLIMRALGDKVVAAAAHPQTITMKNGNSLSVTAITLDDGTRVDTVQITNPQTSFQTEVDLSLNRDGSFDKLTYDQGNTDTSKPDNEIGGPHFEYGFGGNDYEDSNTAQYANGSPLDPNDVGGAIIVNNSYFSTYTPAGPAIETAVTDYDSAMQLVGTALSL